MLIENIAYKLYNYTDKRGSMWSVDYEHISTWLHTLGDEDIDNIYAALEILESEGPNLGRPLVDTLEHTNVHNLKELRPASTGGSEIRILFAFDTSRKAILLVGGDKSKGKNTKEKWNNWYRKAIPEAEKIFREHQSK